MADTEYVRIAAEYVRAKRAYENSLADLKRHIKAKIDRLKNPQHRYPIGAPRPPGKPPASTQLASPVLDWFDKTRFQIHLHRFADYAKAYREYYRGTPSEITGLAGHALTAAETAGLMQRPEAMQDLFRFTQYLIEDRVRQAHQTFRANRNEANALQLIAAIGEAQSLNAQHLPAVRDANRVAQEMIHLHQQTGQLLR
jgi:hypothetical protein